MFRINLDENSITRLNDFQTIVLNDSAIILIDSVFLQNQKIETVAAKLNVETEILASDFSILLRELEKNGFLLKKENLISASDSIFDLKKLWVPVTPIIHIIQNCNSPCIMCDCWKIKEKNWHTPESLMPLFRMLKEKGAASVMLSGGEPLMHPKLKDILLTLNELGLPVELNTNGILLHKNLWILQYDIKEIVISMDSTSVQGYYDIRG